MITSSRLTGVTVGCPFEHDTLSSIQYQPVLNPGKKKIVPTLPKKIDLKHQHNIMVEKIAV